MKNLKNQALTVGAGDGENLSIVGDTYRILITGEQTEKAYAAIDMLIPPNGGPGPHSHASFQEAFYVIEGEIEVRTETQIYVASKGSFVNIPVGGIVHCFKNKTDKTAHLLCIAVPAGMEDFFKEIGKPVAAGTFLPPPEMDPETAEKLKNAAEKYSQKIYPPDYLDTK